MPSCHSAESVFCGSAFEKLSIRAQSQLSPYCLLKAESPERSSMRAGRRRGRSTNDSALLDGSDVPTGKCAHEVTITARCDARRCGLTLPSEPRFGFRARSVRVAPRGFEGASASMRGVGLFARVWI